MKSVFIAYQCDTWLSHDSAEIIGIFTTRKKAIREVVKECRTLVTREEPGMKKCEIEDIVDEAKSELEDNLQTYSMSHYDVNYLIEEIDLNTNIL